MNAVTREICSVRIMDIARKKIHGRKLYNNIKRNFPKSITVAERNHSWNGVRRSVVE